MAEETKETSFLFKRPGEFPYTLIYLDGNSNVGGEIRCDQGTPF